MIRKAVVLSTGDELTSGRVVDTNANYITGKLEELGIETVAVMTVGDDPERLEWAWRTATDLADLVISTGGLGPTADDLTTETVTRLTGTKLRTDEETVAHIRRLFASMGRQMPENNLRQAMFPETAEIIPNPIGTAPGFRLVVNRDGRSPCLVVLPGVPREMKPMMEDSVLPWLAENRGVDTIFAVRVFQTFGLSESALDEAVAGLIRPEEARVGFRASFPQISLRITVEGRPDEAERRLEELCQRVRQKIGQYVFAEGNATMEEVVSRELTEKRLSLALAESCTGGLVAHRLTNVPGSSKYLKGSIVAYSNEVKVGVLGVRPETLENYGAVSGPCVEEMALGARRRLEADLAIAVSGVAGPEGGSAERPVGTVWIGIAAEGSNTSKRYQLRGARDWVKLWASQIALDWLRRFALGLSPADSEILRR